MYIDIVIVTQPSNQCGVVPGSNTSFSVGAVSVVAGGGGPISYMWQYSNGSQLTGDRFQGTNSSTLTIAPVFMGDGGSSFICTVTGESTISLTSQAVILMLGELGLHVVMMCECMCDSPTVLPPPPPPPPPHSLTFSGKCKC